MMRLSYQGQYMMANKGFQDNSYGISSYRNSSSANLRQGIYSYRITLSRIRVYENGLAFLLQRKYLYAKVSIEGQINAPTKICRRRNADEKLCYEEMSCEDSFGYHDIYVISKSRFTADLLNQAKNPNYQKTINICLSVTEVSSNIRLTYVESKIYCHNSHLLP